jgi:hypothetical protein
MENYHPLMPILALLLIQVKHLVIDWIWQPPFEHTNKHLYGHWGGVRHAVKNAIGTGLAIWAGFLFAVPVATVLLLIAVDFVIHYHCDWSKMNLNRYWKLGPLTHPQFWWLTGADQFVHQITYLGLIAFVIAST